MKLCARLLCKRFVSFHFIFGNFIWNTYAIRVYTMRWLRQFSWFFCARFFLYKIFWIQRINSKHRLFCIQFFFFFLHTYIDTLESITSKFFTTEWCDPQNTFVFHVSISTFIQSQCHSSIYIYLSIYLWWKQRKQVSFLLIRFGWTTKP